MAKDKGKKAAADKEKKPASAAAEKPIEDESAQDRLLHEAMLNEAKNNSVSIDVVNQIFNETILQKTAEHIYNQYLQPKIKPYTALQTLEQTLVQVHMDNLTHDIMESKMAKGAQLQHVWDDDEEPIACENDRHVTDNVKHEIKQPFPDLFSRDLEVVGLSTIGKFNKGGKSFSQLNNKAPVRQATASKSLLRKLSMRAPEVKNSLIDLSDTLSSVKVTKKKKSSRRKKSHGAVVEGSDSILGSEKGGKKKKNKKELVPEDKKSSVYDLNMKKDVDRPHEEDFNESNEEIEDAIERTHNFKMNKLKTEAISKAIKQQNENNAGLKGKGGISSTINLRGADLKDFLQKHNTVDKGWTFNYDGTLSEFRKPKITKENIQEVVYEVDSEAIAQMKRSNKKKQQQVGGMFATQGFGRGGNRMDTDYGTEKSDRHGFEQPYQQQTSKMSNTNKQKSKSNLQENEGEFDTQQAVRNMGQKQQIIEFSRDAPSKVIQIQDGVELIEKGKSVRGGDITIQGKLKLKEYQNLIDPRSQQVNSTLNKRQNDRESSQERLDNEDPYRSFRRSLIHEKAQDQSARGPGTANSKRNRNVNQQSQGSRASNNNRIGTGSVGEPTLSIYDYESAQRKINRSSHGGKGAKSMMSLQNYKGQVHAGKNFEYENYLADLNVNTIGRVNDSMHSSYMQIEVSDVEIKERGANHNIPQPKGISRAQTSGGDYMLNLKAPPHVQAGRYNSYGKSGKANTIVASARDELNQMHSTLPLSRMSQGENPYRTGSQALKGYPEAGSKANGLPPVKIQETKIRSMKSLNNISVRNSNERIALYRNESERQDMMKHISDQQANYSRLLAKQRGDNQLTSIPHKQMIKPKSQLETKLNLTGIEKARAVAPKQRKISQLSVK